MYIINVFSSSASKAKSDSVIQQKPLNSFWTLISTPLVSFDTNNCNFLCFLLYNFSLIWTIAILISFGFLVYAVTKEFIEYRSLPTITRTEYAFSSNMNFPAVTICSTSPLSKKRAITNSRRDNYWMSCSAALDFSQPINWSEPEYEEEGYFEPREEEDILNEAIQIEELFLSCMFEGKLLNCSLVFHPVITAVGVCYTFNKDGKMSTTFSSPVENLFLLVNVNEDDMTWSLQTGSGIMVSCGLFNITLNHDLRLFVKRIHT